MGKSTNGPDMLDVLQYIQAVEETTGQRVILLMESDGAGAGPLWRVHAFTSPRDLALLGESKGVGATIRWPDKHHKEMAAALFSLIAWLDGLWAQEKFQEITRPQP